MTRRVLVALLIFLGFSLSIEASTNRYSIITPRPAVTGGDLILTTGSNNLWTLEWEVYTQMNYGYRPLELLSGGILVGSIVDQLFVEHFGGAVALTPWWQIEADLPVVWINEFKPAAVPMALNSTNEMGIGDVFLRNRLTLLRREYHGVGITLNPFVTFPTGDQEKFIGDSKITGGATLGLDGNLGKRVFAALNAGVEVREDVALFDFETSHRLILSGGVGVRLTDHWSLKGDVSTATPINHLFQNKQNTPTELLVANSFRLGESRLNLNVGGALSLVRAAGVPLFRTLTGITYTSPSRSRPEREKIVLHKEEPEETTGRLTVFFNYDSVELSEPSRALLEKVIHPLVKDSTVYSIIVVAGHTDSQGSDEYNMELSLERAESVAQYLKSRGIDSSRIKMEYYGESRPEADNATEEGRNINRRVEVQVVY